MVSSSAAATGARVLIIGAGITGSMIARLLREMAPAGSVEVHVWDKARGAGGRMSVRRSEEGGVTDTGAQYLTEADGIDAFQRAIYAQLAEDQVITPMTAIVRGTRAADGGGKSWVAPKGMSSVSKSFLTKSGAHVSFSRQVKGLRLGPSGSGEGGRRAWEVDVAGDEAQECSPFDAVVLTMPLPQVLALAGDVLPAIRAVPGLEERLASVQYSVRYVLSLFFHRDDDTARATLAKQGWDCRYVSKEEDPNVVFLSNCPAKRGVAAAEPPAVLVHSSVPFALARRNVPPDDAGVKGELIASVNKLLPDLPPPAEVRMMRWGLSQVRYPVEGEPGAVLLGGAGEGLAPLVLAGDAFTKYGSRFDGCTESSRVAASLVLGQLGIQLQAPSTPGAGPTAQKL